MDPSILVDEVAYRYEPSEQGGLLIPDGTECPSHPDGGFSLYSLQHPSALSHLDPRFSHTGGMVFHGPAV